MNTFLPYSDFRESVRCLDYRRLGKQRVEAKQILNALSGKTKGWRRHPATRMWEGYTTALTLYMNLCIREWVRRGYKNNMPEEYVDNGSLVYPSWLGDAEFHASHRSNLLRKDKEWYGQFGWEESPDLPYVWPVQ